MVLIEYLDKMKTLGGPIATISVILLCLFLVVIIVKMLGGMRRGTWRQILRTGVTLIAAVVSYLLAVVLSNRIIGSTDMQSIEDFILFLDNNIPFIADVFRALLQGFDPEAFEYFILLPAAIILLPILSTIIFLLINLVLNIIRSILTKVFGFKKCRTNSQRLGGALLAFTEAMLWIVMVTLPITGVISLIDRACEEAIEADGEDEELFNTYTQFIEPFTENPAYVFISSLGSESLSDEIATVTVKGDKTNLREELLSVAHIGLIEIPKLSEADFGALTEENKLSLNNIVASLKESPFISDVLLGIVKNSSGLISGELIPFDKDGDYAALLDGIGDFLEGVTKDSLYPDISTLLDVYYAISDSRIIPTLNENPDTDLLTLLKQKQEEGDDTVQRIVRVLQKNERTSPLLAMLTKTLIANLVGNIDIGEAEIAYEDIMDGMDAVLSVDRIDFATEEEYMQTLSDTLDSTLSSNGIELEEEIVASMAEYIDSEYSDIDTLTDEQLSDLLLYYYDAYLEYVDSSALEG